MSPAGASPSPRYARCPAASLCSFWLSFSLSSSPPSSRATMATSTGSPIGWLFFLDVMLVACFARVVSYPLYRLRIPRIVGDIIAGCLLGPTVLQDIQLIIFPVENRPLLKLFGTLGLILASATSGAAFDRKVLAGMRLKVVIFALCNIGIPFGATFLLLLFFPTGSEFQGPNYHSISYSIYLGACCCATSLPMAFLILDELKLTNTLAKFMIGTCTLGTILLFTIASVANSFASTTATGFGPFLALFRIGVMFGIILVLWVIQWVWQRSLKKEWHRWFWRTSTDQTILVLTLCVGTAVGTEELGYTYILGAFLAAAFLPSPVLDPLGDESKAALIRANFPKLIKYVSRWIMLPCYFLDIGLQLDIRYLGADWGWIVLGLVWGMGFKMLLIPICKFGFGMSFNDSCFAAFLGNCRGFNALIIGAAAKDAGQFGNVTFALAVLFSIVSSCLAGWCCQIFHHREKRRLEQKAREGKEPPPEEQSSADGMPLHLAVAPFFGDNTGELLGDLVVQGTHHDGREHTPGNEAVPHSRYHREAGVRDPAELTNIARSHSSSSLEGDPRGRGGDDLETAGGSSRTEKSCQSESARRARNKANLRPSFPASMPEVRRARMPEFTHVSFLSFSAGRSESNVNAPEPNQQIAETKSTDSLAPPFGPRSESVVVP
eukprot:GGOE01024324.1.p1 GENE.GGOE01024324.1~~GGOE01024324.1.p1  ORF type:complete len:729 (-),score=149.62 GGOE01024324.1:868-2856(-)